MSLEWFLGGHQKLGDQNIPPWTTRSLFENEALVTLQMFLDYKTHHLSSLAKMISSDVAVQYRALWAE